MRTYIKPAIEILKLNAYNPLLNASLAIGGEETVPGSEALTPPFTFDDEVE